MVPTARSKRPETDEKGIALNLDQWVRMRKLVEAINNDHPIFAMALPCYMQDYHLGVFECRECYPFLNFAKSPPTHSFWNPVEKESNVAPDACRSFYTTLPCSLYQSESGTPTSTLVADVCPGARRSVTTAHRASFAVIQTFTLQKLSQVSNCRTVVTLVGVCVCVCGIKETIVHLKCVFIFEFYTPMHVPIYRSVQCH